MSFITPYLNSLIALPLQLSVTHPYIIFSTNIISYAILEKSNLWIGIQRKWRIFIGYKNLGHNPIITRLIGRPYLVLKWFHQLTKEPLLTLDPNSKPSSIQFIRQWLPKLLPCCSYNVTYKLWFLNYLEHCHLNLHT